MRMALELKNDLLIRHRLNRAKFFRTCDSSKCLDEGTHRAPKSRNELNSFFWFCMFHAREYNNSWNYYDGMSDEDVEKDVRKDTVWQRPTWRLGTNGPINLEFAINFNSIHDPYDILHNTRPKVDPHSSNKKIYSSEQTHALTVFGLEQPGDAANIKKRYKKLVKRYHPDAKGSGIKFDEKIRDVNQAYKVLIDFVSV
jgi:hypothetical protein